MGCGSEKDYTNWILHFSVTQPVCNVLWSLLLPEDLGSLPKSDLIINMSSFVFESSLIRVESISKYIFLNIFFRIPDK